MFTHDLPLNLINCIKPRLAKVNTIHFVPRKHCCFVINLAYNISQFLLFSSYSVSSLIIMPFREKPEVMLRQPLDI